MKYVPLALLTLAATGCGHNEFDVSAAQVSDHRARAKPSKSDQPPMPPKTVKKGDRLLDGTIADMDGTIRSDGR